MFLFVWIFFGVTAGDSSEDSSDSNSNGFTENNTNREELTTAVKIFQLSPTVASKKTADESNSNKDADDKKISKDRANSVGLDNGLNIVTFDGAPSVGEFRGEMFQSRKTLNDKVQHSPSSINTDSKINITTSLVHTSTFEKQVETEDDARTGKKEPFVHTSQKSLQKDVSVANDRPVLGNTDKVIIINHSPAIIRNQNDITSSKYSQAKGKTSTKANGILVIDDIKNNAINGSNKPIKNSSNNLMDKKRIHNGVSIDNVLTNHENDDSTGHKESYIEKTQEKANIPTENAKNNGEVTSPVKAVFNNQDKINPTNVNITDKMSWKGIMINTDSTMSSYQTKRLHSDSGQTKTRKKTDMSKNNNVPLPNKKGHIERIGQSEKYHFQGGITNMLRNRENTTDRRHSKFVIDNSLITKDRFQSSDGKASKNYDKMKIKTSAMPTSNNTITNYNKLKHKTETGNRLRFNSNKKPIEIIWNSWARNPWEFSFPNSASHMHTEFPKINGTKRRKAGTSQIRLSKNYERRINVVSVTKDVSDTVKGKDVSNTIKGKDVSNTVKGKDVSGTIKGKDVYDTAKDKDVYDAIKGEDVSDAIKGKDVSDAIKGKDVPGAIKGKDVSDTAKDKDVYDAIKGKDVSDAIKGKDVPGAIKGKDLSDTIKGKGVSDVIKGKAVSGAIKGNAKPRKTNDIKNFNKKVSDHIQGNAKPQKTHDSIKVNKGHQMKTEKSKNLKMKRDRTSETNTSHKTTRNVIINVDKGSLWNTSEAVLHGKSISSNFEIPGKLLPSELLSSKKIEEIGRVRNKTFSNSSNQNITFETSVNKDKEVNETFMDTGENNMIKQVDSNMKYNHILNGKDQSSSKLANVLSNKPKSEFINKKTSETTYTNNSSGSVLGIKNTKPSNQQSKHKVHDATNIAKTKLESHDSKSETTKITQKHEQIVTKQNKGNLDGYAFRKRLQHNNAERDKITWTSEPFLDILQNYTSPNKYRIMIIPKYKQNEQRVKNHVSIRNESRREDNLIDRRKKVLNTPQNQAFPSKISGKLNNSESFPSMALSTKNSHSVKRTQWASTIPSSRRHFSFFNPDKEDIITLGSRLWILPRLKTKIHQQHKNKSYLSHILKDRKIKGILQTSENQKQQNNISSSSMKMTQSKMVDTFSKSVKPLILIANKSEITNHNQVRSAKQIYRGVWINGSLKYGLPLRNITELDVVTKSGSQVHIEQKQNDGSKLHSNIINNLNKTKSVVGDLTDSIDKSEKKYVFTRNTSISKEDHHINSPASSENILLPSVSVSSKDKPPINPTKNNSYRFSNQLNNVKPNVHIIKSQNDPKDFMNTNWKIQTMKSSYVIAVPSITIPKNNSEPGDVIMDVDDDINDIPASLSKLHERLRIAWRKRKRTYVPESRIDQDDIDTDSTYIGTKLVAAITNKSTIMLDIPGIKITRKGKESGGIKSKTSDITAINTSTTLKSERIEGKKTANHLDQPHVLDLSLNRLVKPKMKKSNNKDGHAERHASKHKVPTILPYLVRSNTGNMMIHHGMQKQLQMLSEKRNAKTIKMNKTKISKSDKEETARGSKNARNKIPTVIPYIIRSNPKFLNRKNTLPDITANTTEKANSTISNLQRSPTLKITRPLITFKGLSINSQRVTANDTRRIRKPTRTPSNRNVISNLKIIRRISRKSVNRPRPVQSNANVLSPSQLRQIQQAMNAIRSRQPQQRPSVVQIRTSRRRNMNRLPTGQVVRSSRTPSSNIQWVNRVIRRNNVMSNPSSRAVPRIGFQMNNGNIRRLISPSNLRTRLRGQMSSRRFINSNTRNVQQRNSNRNNGVVQSNQFLTFG